jgi:hypothetical protein
MNEEKVVWNDLNVIYYMAGIKNKKSFKVLKKKKKSFLRLKFLNKKHLRSLETEILKKLK